MLPSDFVILGLGSNRPTEEDSCVDLLRKACAKLSPLFKNLELSSIYCTKPMYVENQNFFHNMVFCGFLSSKITPDKLLEEIHKIEASLGRDRSREIRNGPRTIDIDIELYGSERVEQADLQIPHPRIQERAFVQVPLFDALSGKFKYLRTAASTFLGIEQNRIPGSSDVEFFMDAASFMMPIKNIVEKN